MFDEYLKQCESRLKKHDLSIATVVGYRRVLDSIWRPTLGTLPFLQVRYSMLVKIAISHKAWGKKTYNNAVSILRRASLLGYRDHPYRSNPAWSMKGAQVKRRDLPRIDPFRIQDAEELIAAIHGDWGEAQGNFHEFRFFTWPFTEILSRATSSSTINSSSTMTANRFDTWAIPRSAGV